MRFCAEGGCPDVAVTGNFCAVHSDPLKRAAHNTQPHVNSAWYGRAEWKGKYGVRQMKLHRNPFCEICKIRKASQVHHTRPEWKEKGDWFLFLGGYDLEFLQ